MARLPASAHAARIERMLENWNRALQSMHPPQHPDRLRPLRLYAPGFQPGDKAEIPLVDLPPWAPDWMRLNDGCTDRSGTGKTKHASILVCVPSGFLP
jgi:hypothetical protein